MHMEYIAIGICVVAVIAICTVLILKSKKKKDEILTALVETHNEEARLNCSSSKNKTS